MALRLPWRRTADRSLTAAAVNVMEDGPAVMKARAGEDAWQREAWRHYDICGELRFATGWLANVISLADMYAAEVDPVSGTATERSDDPRVQAVVATILGGPAKRPQAQKTIALNWQVGGESWIVIRPRGRGMPDQWITLSSREVEERSGSFSYVDPFLGTKVKLTSRDKLIRHWNPHPAQQVHADSAVRAALPDLHEIELTSQNIAARLVSRLASNGILFLPAEMEFPRGDGDPPGPAGVMAWLAKAGEASMQDVGQAGSQMPLVMMPPGELIDKIMKLDLASELSKEILELRQDALKRLVTALDMPSEIVEGMGDSNHWSAWQIEEAAYKVHVAPALDRLGESLTEQYMHPTLAAMGVERPERFMIAFDTTEIVTRPNRTTELIQLWDNRLISDEYMRGEAGVPESAKPTEDERVRRMLESLVTGAPTLLADASVQDALGVDLDIVPAGAVPVEEIETTPAPDNVRALPERAPQGDEDEVSDALVAAAELIVFDAFSRAGGRLLTRAYRGQFQSTPKHELHTAVPLDDRNPYELLEGSFQFVEPVARAHGLDPTVLKGELREYCRSMISYGQVHDRNVLMRYLRVVPRG